MNNEQQPITMKISVEFLQQVFVPHVFPVWCSTYATEFLTYEIATYINGRKTDNDRKHRDAFIISIIFHRHKYDTNIKSVNLTEKAQD